MIPSGDEEHAIPDALFRAPVSEPSSIDTSDAADQHTASVAFITVAAVNLHDGASLLSDENAAPHLEDPILLDLREAT